MVRPARARWDLSVLTLSMEAVVATVSDMHMQVSQHVSACHLPMMTERRDHASCGAASSEVASSGAVTPFDLRTARRHRSRRTMLLNADVK